MEEERWGEEWHIGDRIRYRHPALNYLVEGVIKNRSWGRDKGKPIYHFTVLADGENESFVIGPAGVLPITSDPLPSPPSPKNEDAVDQASPQSADSGYPVPQPERTGFGPVDSDNMKEWNKDRRKWERDQELGQEK